MSHQTNIEIPVTKYHRITNIICILLLVAPLIYLMWNFRGLPEQIPTHYDEFGVADGFGGKGSIWILPILSIGMYVLISVLERHPGVWNTGVSVTHNNKEGVYRTLKNLIVTVKLTMVLIFSYLSVQPVRGENLGAWFLPITLGLMFIPMVFFLIRMARIPK